MSIINKLFWKKREEFRTDVIETWVVKWQSRYGNYSGNVKSEFESFTRKEDAELFAKALKEAYEFIKHTSGTQVELYKQK